MTPKQIAALNAAGEALKDLGLGKVRLSWLPADSFVPHDSFVVSLEAPDMPGLCMAEGATPAEALDGALALAARPLAKAA